MCPLCVRRSSSVTGLLSTWLLRDFSLFRTPPPGLRSRGGAAVLCPPPGTFSATGASLRALAPLIVQWVQRLLLSFLPLSSFNDYPPLAPSLINAKRRGRRRWRRGCRMSRELSVNGQPLVFVSTCCTVAMTTRPLSRRRRLKYFATTSTRGRRRPWTL